MGIADQPVIERGYELPVSAPSRSREQRSHLVGSPPGECAGEQRVEVVIWAHAPDQPAHVGSPYPRLKYAPAARSALTPTCSRNIPESPYVLDYLPPTRHNPPVSSRREKAATTKTGLTHTRDRGDLTLRRDEPVRTLLSRARHASLNRQTIAGRVLNE
jgi:hypothetical protein